MTDHINRSKEVLKDNEKVVSKKSFWIDYVPAYAAVIGIVVGLTTAIVGVASYREQARKDLATRDFESKKPFFDKQIEFYVDAMETVSKIAVSESPTKDDIVHFWTIYWGRLAAVEDEDVDKAMVIFGKKLDSKSPAKCLQDNALLLAHCVKKSWENTWKVPLGEPPELPCNAQSFQIVDRCPNAIGSSRIF
jgi:hypothetical protein